MLVRLSLCFILIGLVSLTLSSCDVTGGGLIVQVTSKSGGSVSGIELFLIDDQGETVSSAVTTESGEVRWTDVPSGEYNLLASRKGIYYYDQLINIESDKTETIEIFIP